MSGIRANLPGMHKDYLDVSVKDPTLDDGTEGVPVDMRLSSSPSFERIGLGMLGDMILRHRMDAKLEMSDKRMTKRTNRTKLGCESEG